MSAAGSEGFQSNTIPPSPIPRRKVAVVAGAALVILTCLFAFAQLDDPQRAGRTGTSPAWGVYQILWSRNYCEELDHELASFASRPAYVMFFRDLGRPYPKGPNACITKRGATPIISLELWSWHDGERGSYLSAITTGKYDPFLRQWARDAKADGRRVLLRFGFEFNGNWFGWCGDPEAFKKAWRHAHDLFREVGADNVEWLWSPNVVSCPDKPGNAIPLYYPGDDYVDWVGVDGYNFGEHHDEWHGWQSFDDVFSATLNDLHARYAGKPIMVSELGCAPGEAGQQATWIRGAWESLRRRPYVKAVVWFNYDKRREREPNWRLDATPDLLRAFNETFAAPRPAD